MVTYMGIMQRTPVLLDTRRVGFRNAVTHKGYIPTKAEAIDYGQAVLDVLRPAMREMQTALEDGVQRAVSEHVSAGAAAAAHSSKIATHGLMTIVCMARVPPRDKPEKSLEESLGDIRGWQSLTQ